jgi:hypothetical protein
LCSYRNAGPEDKATKLRRAARVERPSSGAQVASKRAAFGATGLDAMAVGASVIGALPIGTLAIRVFTVKRGSIEPLNIEELEVGRQHVRGLLIEQEQRPSAPRRKRGFHGKGSGPMNARARVQPVRTKLRTWLLVAAASVTIFAILHHVDHVIRGNHSGWPFQEAVTPFTFSLLIYVLLLPGLYVSSKGRLMAGYWLFTAVVGLSLVVWVHFVPTRDYEAPIEDIYAVYGSALTGLLALIVLAGLVSSLVTLVVMAIWSLRTSERQ